MILLVDTCDMKRTIKKLYGKRARVNYEKLLADSGAETAVAYGCVRHRDTNVFRRTLEGIGYTCHFVEATPWRRYWNPIVAMYKMIQDQDQAITVVGHDPTYADLGPDVTVWCTGALLGCRTRPLGEEYIVQL